MEEEHMNTLQSIFAGIDDARVERTRLHTLLDIMIIAILGVLCGADGWVEIEAFGNTKEAWLNTFLELPSAHPVTRYRCRVSLPASIPSSLRSVCLSWVLTLELNGRICRKPETANRAEATLFWPMGKTFLYYIARCTAHLIIKFPPVE